MVLCVVTGIFLLFPVFPSQATEQQPAQSNTVQVTKPSETIPLGDIPSQATEVHNLLRTLDSQFEPSSEIKEIEKNFPALRNRFAAEIQQSKNIIDAQPILSKLQVKGKLWQKNARQGVVPAA